MSWHQVRVRPVVEADLPVLLALAGELREELLPGDAGRGRGGTRPALEQRYLDAIVDPDRHLIVAVDPGSGDAVLGMALLTVAPTHALLDVPAVHVNHAVVAGSQRRRGAGRALVAAAATFAEERGIEQLVVSVHPGSRDAARFFARLGFAPLAVRRTAPVAVVRRRLAMGERTADPRARVRSARSAMLASRVRS